MAIPVRLVMHEERGPQQIVSVPRTELLEFAWPVFERKMKKDAEMLEKKWIKLMVSMI